MNLKVARPEKGKIKWQEVLICTLCGLLLLIYVLIWFPSLDKSRLNQTDFIIYYSAGRVPLSRTYDIGAHREVQTEALGSELPVGGGAMPFNHAPLMVPLLHLFMDDDYKASYI